MSYAEKCQPYSEQACRDAAKALGLQLGSTSHAFTGKYEQKGCYAYSAGKYAGKAYYGTGGSVEDMQKEGASNTYRPNNYDCEGDHIPCMHACVCMLASIYVCNSLSPTLQIGKLDATTARLGVIGGCAFSLLDLSHIVFACTRPVFNVSTHLYCWHCRL